MARPRLAARKVAELHAGDARVPHLRHQSSVRAKQHRWPWPRSSQSTASPPQVEGARRRSGRQFSDAAKLAPRASGAQDECSVRCAATQIGMLMTGEEGVEQEQLALLGAATVLRGLLAAATRDEVLTRHQAGMILRDIKGAPGTYGVRCVERIGAELGIAPATLYRYMAVAENWSAAEIRVESTKTNRFGQPPAWSHFLALTRAPDSSSRRALLDECMGEGWTARELAERIAELTDEASRNDRPRSAEDPLQTALAAGIHCAARASGDLSVFASALAARLGDPDAAADGDLVTRAITAFEELREQADSALAQLHAASRASGGRLRAATRARVAVRASQEPVMEADDESDEEPAALSPPRKARARHR